MTLEVGIIEKTTNQKSKWKMEKGALGRHFTKTCDFEKAVAINMSFMEELWHLMQTNKDFRMVLEYHAEERDVDVVYVTCGSDVSQVEG